MSREHLPDNRREALRLLDLVRAGFDVPASAVTWALWVCGDLTDTDTE
jgi:hypothetical protein